MNKIIIFLILVGFSRKSFSQGQGYNWCFGDSAYVTYSAGNMVNQPFSSVRSGEMAASVSNKNGSLLFYLGGISQNSYYLNVYNKNHQIILNGDSLFGFTSSTNGCMIIPSTYDTSIYYVMTNRYNQNLFNNYLYLTNIDMSLNFGDGGVTSKNVLLLNQKISEKMAMVQHGNGKDWWFIVHSFSGNIFYVYYIDSSGIHNPIIQSIGTNYSASIGPNYGDVGEMLFSQYGTKLVAVGPTFIDLFDFDRCTGSINNFINLAPIGASYPEDLFYGCSFSPNDSILYVSDWVCTNTALPPIYGNLYQYDLSASNIAASRQTIFTFSNSPVAFGQHQLFSDGKVYVTTNYHTFPNYTFDSTTMYLSTIENPNVLGLGCNFQLYSFYLGGHRALAGLPNMPNYNLGALAGSPCDTLTEIKEIKGGNKLKGIVFPNPNNGMMRYSYYTESATSRFVIYDVTGRELTNYSLKNKSNVLFIDQHNLSKGIYQYKVLTDSGEEKDRGKLIIVK